MDSKREGSKAGRDRFRRLEAARKRENVRDYIFLDFAWFVAVRGLSDAYDEVLSAMESDRRDEDLMSPPNQYRYFGALALITADLGDSQYAQRMARNALAAKAQTHGPFKDQPELGTVSQVESSSFQRIVGLAGD